MHYPILETILIILCTVLVVNFVFKLLQLPVILGYLVVGTLVGPHVIGWIPDTQTITPLAEFGVVFLMFTIGLEFSLPKLITLKYRVFILGGIQVILSIFITLLFGLMLKMSFVESIIIGCIVAMSSTAIVVKILSEQFEIHSIHGLNAVGILLFQDLAVIPILTIIAALSGVSDQPLMYSLLYAFLKGLAAILVIITIGHWLLRPIFHYIASTRIVELFTLTVLFIAIGSAWLTAKLGMTLVLGAFLSGIMLGETEFRHQIKTEIRPFRDILLGLFFVSIGMLANIHTWLDTWPWILLLLIAIMLGKSFLIMLLCRLSGYNQITSFRTGLILSQGGEFGFAIFALAFTHNLLPADYAQVVLAALLISFAFAPIIIRYNGQITKKLMPTVTKLEQSQKTAHIQEVSEQLRNHVIICGFGRVGQHIARFLKETKQPYIAFDLDPEIIHNSSLAGEPVLYGNTTHPDILQAAKINEAKAIVISFNDVAAATNMLSLMQTMNIKIPSLVRCKDEVEFEQLREHGATKIVTEVFEESLTMTNHLLRILHIPQNKIHSILHKARENDYQILMRVFPGSFPDENEESMLTTKHLRSVHLSDAAPSINKTLEVLNLPDVEIITVIRGKKQLRPSDVKLRANDIVILHGLPDQLDEAEELLSPNDTF